MIDEGRGNVNFARTDGATPILIACENNCDYELIELMVNAGGSLNQIQRNGWSCLMMAVGQVASPTLVGRLLYWGANPTIRERIGGRSALDYARLNFDRDCERLIEKARLFMALLGPKRCCNNNNNTSLTRLLPLELMRRNLCLMLFTVCL